MINFYYARMSICNQIVISHGGMFGFELSPKGPKFGFLIPLDHMNSNLSTSAEVHDVLDFRKEDQSSLAAASVPIVSGELHAIVVDDIKTNRVLLSRLVSKRGVIVDEMFEDGKKAVDYIKQHAEKINIIFMDNIMPVMTGIECTAYCRNEGNYGGLIIGVTGNTLGEEVTDFMNSGADIILGKPVNVKQLDAILNHIKAHGKYSPKSKVHASRNNEELKERFEKLIIEVKDLYK